MPAQIFFKFKSQLKFDSITFDGLSISAKEVRRSIVAKKKMKIDESDLQLTNAASNEEYAADEALIPENTSLIVVRLPRGSGSGPKVYNPVDKTTTKMSYTSSFAQAQAAAQKELAIQAAANPQVKIADSIGSMDISKMTGSEEDKIATMQKYSGSDFDPSKYVNMPAKPPPSYICHRCGQPGHFIKYCTYLGPPKATTQQVKKATGIPMVHTKPASQDTPGALLTSTGDYVVPIIDSQAISEGKVEKPPFLESDSDEERNPETIEESPEGASGLHIPNSYKCQLCSGPYKMAVITPCCGESFCDDCITDRLMKNEKKCYVCASTISVDSLIPNKSLRDAVIKWQNDVGMPLPNKLGSGTSPQHVMSGSSSPFHASGTPQKPTAVDSSSESTEIRAEKLKSSLTRRLQAVEEMENEDETTKATSINNQSEASTATKDSAMTSTVANSIDASGSSNGGNSNGGLMKEMTKTLSDLYGAINWDDVAKTGNKNNATANDAPLATSANNLPYISNNASLPPNKSAPDSLASLGQASSHQTPSSGQENTSNNSKVREKSPERSQSPQAIEFETVKPGSGGVPVGGAGGGGGLSPEKASTGKSEEAAVSNVESAFDMTKLSQSDAELLKSLFRDAKKAAEKEASSAATVAVSKPAPQALPFPPPHMIPSGGAAAAAALWPGNPAAALHLNSLLMPSILPMPMPPAAAAAASAATATSDSLLGVPFMKKPLSEKEFYERQKKLTKKSGDTNNIRRLEAKLLEKQLQQLASSDDPHRSDRKMRKIPRRNRSRSPGGGKIRPEVKKYARGSSRDRDERRKYKYKDERHVDSKRPVEGRRYEPYPPQSKRYRKYSRSRSRTPPGVGGGGRGPSLSRSPRTRSPSPRGYRRLRQEKSPSLIEISDPLEEVLRSARQNVEHVEEQQSGGRPIKDFKKRAREEVLSSPHSRHHRKFKRRQSISKSKSREVTSVSPRSFDEPNENKMPSETQEEVKQVFERSDRQQIEPKLGNVDEALLENNNQVHREPAKEPNSFSPDMREGTPTLDEKPEEIAPSVPQVDLSLLSSVDGLIRFETEEERKVAEDILKQAQIKILEHRRKMLLSKQDAKSNSGTPEHPTQQDTLAPEKTKALIAYVESPRSEAGSEISKRDSDIRPEIVTAEKIREAKDEKKEPMGLVQYASEGSENEHDQILFPNSVAEKSPQKKGTSHNEHKLPTVNSGNDQLNRSHDKIMTPVENGDNEIAGTIKSEAPHPRENGEVLLEEKEERSKTGVPTVVDTESVHSSQEMASQPSDYDHPQLSGEDEFIPGVNDGIESMGDSSPDKQKNTDVTPRKKRKQLRVEPPPPPPPAKESLTSAGGAAISSTADSDNNDVEPVGKKQKKEKKSKSKKAKERYQSPVEDSQPSPKKESKSKKKKKKKAKEEKESKKGKSRRSRSSSSESQSKELPISSDIEEEQPTPTSKKNKASKYDAERSVSPVPKRSRKEEGTRGEEKRRKRRSRSVEEFSDEVVEEEQEKRHSEKERKRKTSEDRRGPVSSAVVTHSSRDQNPKSSDSKHRRKSRSPPRVVDREDSNEVISGTTSKSSAGRRKNRKPRENSRSPVDSRSPTRSPVRKQKNKRSSHSPGPVQPMKRKVTALLPGEPSAKRKPSKRIEPIDSGAEDEKNSRKGREPKRKQERRDVSPPPRNKAGSHYSEISGSESDVRSYRSRSSSREQPKHRHKRDVDHAPVASRSAAVSHNSSRRHEKRPEYDSRSNDRFRRRGDKYSRSRSRSRSPYRESNASYHSKKEKRRK